jgi:hypothetical protein
MELSENRSEPLNPEELVQDHHDCYLAAALKLLLHRRAGQALWKLCSGTKDTQREVRTAFCPIVKEAGLKKCLDTK